MERRSFLGGLAGTPLAAGTAAAQTAKPWRRPPNVLFILFDKCRRGRLRRLRDEARSHPRISTRSRRTASASTPTTLRRACADRAALPSSRACIPTSTACARTATRPMGEGRIPTTDAIPIPSTTSDFISGTTSPMSCTMPATRRPTSASGTWVPSNPGFFRYLADLQLADVPLDRQAARVRLSSPTCRRTEASSSSTRTRIGRSSSTSPSTRRIRPWDPPRKYYEPYQGGNLEPKGYYETVTSLDWNVGRLVENPQKEKDPRQHPDHRHHRARNDLAEVSRHRRSRLFQPL